MSWLLLIRLEENKWWFQLVPFTRQELQACVWIGHSPAQGIGAQVWSAASEPDCIVYLTSISIPRPAVSHHIFVLGAAAWGGLWPLDQAQQLTAPTNERKTITMQHPATQQSPPLSPVVGHRPEHETRSMNATLVLMGGLCAPQSVFIFLPKISPPDQTLWPTCKFLILGLLYHDFFFF